MSSNAQASRFIFPSNPSANYDPHLNRQVEKPTSYFQALMHLTKGTIGIGVLAMPEGFKFAGYSVGILLGAFVAMLATYTTHMLVTCQYILCKKLEIPFMSFADTMECALENGPEPFRRFSVCGRYIINVILIIYQLGICCMYFIFSTENIRSVINIHIENKLSMTQMFLMVLVPIVLLNMIPNLRYLAPVSTLAILVTVFAIIIITYYVIRDFPADISDRKLVGDPIGIIVFFGFVVFAAQAIGPILSVERSMKNPKQFLGLFGVLPVMMVIVYFIHTLIGLGGYFTYGEDIKTAITLSLPQSEWLAQLVRALYGVIIIFTYPIHCYLPREMIWDLLIEPRISPDFEHKLLVKMIMGLAIAFLTCGLAMTVPFLKIVITFFGNFVVIVGIVCPALLDICIRHPDYGEHKWHLIKDISIIIIGMFALIVGFVTSIQKLITK